MSTFDERERAYENMFARDAEMRFMARARRNKILGKWASVILGMTGDEAQDYVDSLIRTDLQAPDREAIIAKVSEDLKDYATPEEVREKLEEYEKVAMIQLVHKL